MPSRGGEGSPRGGPCVPPARARRQQMYAAFLRDLNLPRQATDDNEEPTTSADIMSHEHQFYGRPAGE